MTRISDSNPAIPGLKVVHYRSGTPVGFIVDTRGLSLEERNMSRATTSGPDMTRAEFLAGLQQALEESDIDSTGTLVIVKEDSQ